MKTYILFILATLSYGYNSFSQQKKQGEIIYSIELTSESIASYINSDHRKKMDKKSRIAIDKSMLNSNTAEAILKFSGEKSIYTVDLGLKNEGGRKLSSVGLLAGSNNVYYVNSSKKENLEQDCKLMGECFLISNPVYKWSLTQETKKIGNYLCFKAVSIKIYKGKKSYKVAWYTPSIPVNFGPKDFNGLPGLILELEAFGLIFKAKKIKLNLNETIVINKPKGINITQFEFRKLYAKSNPGFRKLIKN